MGKQSDTHSFFGRRATSICLFVWACLALFNLPIGKAHAEINYHLTPPYSQDTCNLVSISMGESIVGDSQCVEGTSAHVGAYGVTITVDPLDGKQHTFDYIIYHNNCPQGFTKPCTQHLISDVGKNQTTPATIDIAMQTPATGAFCGTYQDDFVITSIDGNSNCHYGDPNSTKFGSSSPGSAGFCATYVNCPGPAPHPGYSIAGNIYQDANNNQHFDAGEVLYSRGTNIISITGPTNFTTTTANGNYTTEINLPAGSYTVSYINIPTGYSVSYPRSGPPPSFLVTVGPGCSTNGANDATCDKSGNITNLNFGITTLTPWLQATCGDIRLDSGLSDPIPQSALCGSSPCPYALLSSTSCTAPGIAFTGDTTADFGQGQASASPANWLAGGSNFPEVFPTTSAMQVAESTLLARAQQEGLAITDIATVSGCTNLADCTLPANLPHGIYLAQGDLSLNAYTFPANQNYVFLVNGNLTIQGNLSLPLGEGSTALFAATGNISIAPTVGGNPSATQSNLDGFYIAGNSFLVNSTGTCNDLRVNIAGSVVVNAEHTGGTFQNSRDLCGNDATSPTLTVTLRPDLLLNAPSLLLRQQTVSQEEAP